MAVVAYVPALYKGYFDFFTRFPGELYLLDAALIAKVYPKIARDFRAVDASDMAAAIASLNAMAEVKVLDDKTIQKFSADKVVMPDEDVSHLIAEKYFKNVSVEFVPTHLRWDGWATAKETPVTPGRKVSHDQLDKELMGKATVAAQKSPDWWRQVGALIARDGEVLFVGHNRPNPSDVYTLNALGDPRSNFDAGERYDLTTAEHAEAHLIGQAARKGVALDGASMYVTTFPCPTCAKLIVVAGIKKVFYADGYSLVDAEAVFKDCGIEVILIDESE